MPAGSIWQAVPPPDEANARADEILSRAEFAPPERSLVDRAIDWVLERLGGLLTSLFSGGQGSFLSWIVLGACVVAVAAVIVVLVRSLRRDRSVAAIADVRDVTRTAAEWRAEAERLEAAGSWKAALRARYRELVAELVERAVVRDVPGRTTGEHRAEVRRREPAVAGDFDAASSLFDAAWYGDLPTGAEENRTFRDHGSRVLAGLSRARGPAPEGAVDELAGAAS